MLSFELVDKVRSRENAQPLQDSLGSLPEAARNLITVYYYLLVIESR